MIIQLDCPFCGKRLKAVKLNGLSKWVIKCERQGCFCSIPYHSIEKAVKEIKKEVQNGKIK